MTTKKNIMVISVNTWHDEGGSNTLQNLFKDFNPNNIYSLYMRSDLPNTKYCNHFYQIREVSLLRKILCSSEKVGNKVMPINLKGDIRIKQENKAKNIYKSINNSFILCLRELLWYTNKWKENALKNYILESNIDTIFVLVSSFIYSNKIALHVKELVPNAKVVLYFVDDNYSYKAVSKSPFSILHRFYVRRILDKLVAKASEIFVISSKMKEEYDNYFNRSTSLLTKGVDMREINVDSGQLLKGGKVKMLYIGNLLYGRQDELFNIGKHINALNEKHGNKIQFDIYTQTEVSKYAIDKFNNLTGCLINKPVPYSQVKQLQNEYDILIFIESFKNRYMRATRLSFSTKVTDYLSSGKVIWAIGPDKVASIKYFKNNNCALVSTSRDKIKLDLENILFNPSGLLDFTRNAINCCRKNHDKKIITNIFTNAFK